MTKLSGLNIPTNFTSHLTSTTDLICFSHLRWDFVYQRPQHLLSRFSRHCRVFYFEEPMWHDGKSAFLQVSQRQENIFITVPQLPRGLSEKQTWEIQRNLLDDLFGDHDISSYRLWYYTPMALSFSDHLSPQAQAIVYDCMDELSGFKGAHPELPSLEDQMFLRADLVFTGGHSLFEAKRHKHSNIHPFPSSIDFDHFSSARTMSAPIPHDQQDIPSPRIGFFGVIDERMNLKLIQEVAETQPHWQLILIGPTAKISPASLPRNKNIHYLGMKSYAELPKYLAGWDVAMLPFAHNESTRFISPTKTPEYLAAGKPVVSTSIRDVIHPYGKENLVRIADTSADFIDAITEILQAKESERSHWLQRVDDFLTGNSWDKTWEHMSLLFDLATTANYPHKLSV